MSAVAFRIPFTPVAKQRARSVYANQGVKHYTPDETAAWERTVAMLAKGAMQGLPPIQGPLEVCLEFVLVPPPSWAKWRRAAACQGFLAPTVKPDLDNLVKAIMDGLNEVAWVDDCQVVRQVVGKAYGSEPGVHVHVRSAPRRLAANATREEFNRLRLGAGKVPL